MTPPNQDARDFDDHVPHDLPQARLSENARIVLARRYLKKDESGEPTEEAETMFWRIARVIAEEDRKFGAFGSGRRGGGAELLRIDDDRPVRAQLPDADERGPAPGAALRVLRAPRRGRALQRRQRHLRHAAGHGARASIRRGHRLFLLPAAAGGGRQRAIHDGGGIGPGLLHAPLRCLDGGGEAGRHPPGGQHGDSPGRPPRHP